MVLDPADIDLNRLENLIRETGKPVHINQLTREAVAAWVKQDARKRQYAPGATYDTNDVLEFQGRLATITDTQPGYNSKQGEFQILTLIFADGSHQYMAAGIVGAPTIDRIEVTPEQVQRRLAEDDLSWRTVVHDALAEDDRFVHFHDEQGDQWCLVGLLTSVREDEVQSVRTTIQSEVSDPFEAVSTEKLVSTIWDIENDGSDNYLLSAFALNVALQEFRDVEYVAGAGWMLAEHLRAMEQRLSLVGPRMANVVPEATAEEEVKDAPIPVPELDEKVPELTPDVESWRKQRRNEVAFTLHASHYYRHWLPLTRNMAGLFPPRQSRVTIYHRFGGEERSFQAVINSEQKRILAERTMYDTFREHGVYPGAKLIISQRSGEYEYDIRTIPAESNGAVIVRRISLDDDGRLEYWDDEEPLRYRVDGDVFIADARWEDLPALFLQAEKAGQGIFGLMFKQCQKWEQKRGSPLLVTADELFRVIHYGSRMTSKATISYELWRRLAFEPMGQGRYKFRPEMGDRTRTRAQGLTGGRSGPISSQPVQHREKTRPPVQLGEQQRLLDTQDADLVSVGPLFEEPTASVEPESPATGYFIFQQKPDSEYDDQTGSVYNWRQGIPGYKQIEPGARFIYYRPGEQVFFGCGRIDWIEVQQDDNGRNIYDGLISDYEQWKPALPLTRSLANQLSFVRPERLGVGQAGIRKINATDFETIRRAHRYFLSQRVTAEANQGEGPKVTGENETNLHEDEFNRMRELIAADLTGETVCTLTGVPNVIRDITKSGILVQSSQGVDEVRWEWIEQIYDRLRERGELEGKELRSEKPRLRGSYRSAFIFGLLVQFKHISAQLKPIRLFYNPTKEVELRTIGSSPADSSSLKSKKPSIWTEKNILDQFQAIRIWRRGDKIAHHKPLLLIYALARCKQGAPRLTHYTKIDKELSKLLVQFNPESQQQRTEDPFWRLQNDGLWEVKGVDQSVVDKSKRIPTRNELLQHSASGGFPQPLYDALQADPDLIEKIIITLLESYFSQSEHQAVREAVGLVAPEDSPSPEPDKPAVWTEEKIIAQFRNRAFKRLGNFARAVPGELTINKQLQPYLTDPEDGKEIIEGSQVAMYELVETKKGSYLDRSKYLSDHKSSKKAYAHQEQRVVYQRYVPQKNSRRLIATILPAEQFCSYSVGYLTDVQSYKLGFLVALLNSNLLNWRFRLDSINNTVNGYEVEKLRIPAFDFSVSMDNQNDDYEAVLDTYLEELINDETDIVDWLQRQISNVPDSAVVIHDLLDLCVREMIELHEEKQSRAQEFLNWLEEYSGLAIGNWSLKTITRNYYEVSWDEFMRVLNRNALAIEQASGIDVRSSKALDRIKQEFEQSKLVLMPLLERIQAIDSLINQIVYRLYNLTEEEIAKVEGSLQVGNDG